MHRDPGGFLHQTGVVWTIAGNLDSLRYISGDIAVGGGGGVLAMEFWVQSVLGQKRQKARIMK